MTTALLQAHPFTKGFWPDHLTRLAAMASEVIFTPGELIFHEGDHSSLFYLLIEGNVALEVHPAGRAVRISTLVAGEVLGWSSVTGDTDKQFGARALEEVHALAFDGARLRHACEEDYAFGFWFMRAILNVMSERLHAIRAQLLRHLLSGCVMNFVSADEALGAVRSGQRVYIHNGCSEPLDLVRALTRRGHELSDVEVLHMATMGIAPYSAPEFEGHFRHNGLFLASNVRQAVQEGRADYTPIFLSEIEGLFTSGAVPIDVCLLQCSPPDRHGYMSLGASTDVSLTAAECARHVIVEVNPQVPWTYGDTFLHVSKVHAFVEATHPLVEYPGPQVTAVHKEIGRRVSSLIPDGATIQTGIGGIPEAVLGFLGGHKDLAVHSEMIPEGALALIEKGVINRKLVAGFVLGTKRLFQFIDRNPMFEFHRTAHVNDPFVVAKNDRMVAINSAIEVDLTGQVCSDSMGHAPYSGIGGQVDFLRGAARSKGGVPIIALPATARRGRISRIVPTLQPGAGVVTSRGDVHYVITEHGVAYLHGKTLRQRAEAMIGIAAPEFRHELQEAAVRSKLLDHPRATV